MKDQNIGDATDKTGAIILHSFQDKLARQVMAGNEGREESLQLEPRLTGVDGKLKLSFRVGEGKLYVVKDLIEFCEMVRNSETGTYGNSTQINHQLSHFTERSREWYDFLSKVAMEEEEMERRIEESMRYYYRNNKCSSLELYGWRLDQFFEVLGSFQVEYEDKDGRNRKKELLKTKESNPEIIMKIQKCDLGKNGTFHGIKVSCRMPVFYQGMETFYYVENGFLCKAQKEFVERIEPLEEQAENGMLQFRVGRKNLSEFYYSFLPRFQECIEIEEQDSKVIHSYLPPEVEFLFYLDAQNHNMTCRVHALYGEREVSVFDLLDDSGFSVIESFRMKNRESEMLYRARQLFPEIDIVNDELHCGQDEELMYQVLEHGVEELMNYGEVKCTQRFRNMNLLRQAKVAVGVSVSQGLLNLEISTEDISREELLDILKGYRTRKKFYRLKNGDFLSMENDALKMLCEMMEALHLSPKEFVKGKMQLPAYRTLYLDKLLEENESVYLTRDSRFREMVKSFKTISDADFEEPAELSGIMRGYQKNGYKCMGLSLSDQYWICPLEKEISWSDVNFFENVFSDDVGDILFGKKVSGRKINLCSPDNTSDGWLRKKWSIIEGKRCLLKGGSGINRQEPYNEVFASALMKRLDIPHVSYTLMMQDEEPYSVCEDLITPQTELVSAWYIMETEKKENHISVYQHYLNCCERLGIKGIKDAIDRMLVVDYLIVNEDRHQNNFGVVRNAENLEWVGAAPIYDSGTSLWFSTPTKLIHGNASKITSKPFKTSHDEQIKLVSSFEWLEEHKLHGLDEEFREIVKASPFMDEARCDAICSAIRKRTEKLIEVMEDRVKKGYYYVEKQCNEVKEDVAYHGQFI